ncbi:MAG TPA: diaminopimelate epimerase [Puia sp.]|nr:diaminopimelate epimerase [Puia sp.]
MNISFFKYQGTGNDFILVDNRSNAFSNLSQVEIERICDRRFSIGADGLMMLNHKDGYDFEMKYYNSDGKPGSMCGNGGRCIVRFAYDLGIHKESYHFLASDGEHEAEIETGSDIINLKMKDVAGYREENGHFIVDTGSPHYIKFVKDVMGVDVVKEGTDIRYSEPFAKEGINVNFVESKGDDEIIVRTYERGVEDETFSCGTGVTASALVCHHNDVGYNDVTVKTKGGTLVVKYDRSYDNKYTNVWLCGPAEKSFEGKVDVKL